MWLFLNVRLCVGRAVALHCSHSDRWTRPASLWQQTHTEEPLTTCFRKGLGMCVCVCVCVCTMRLTLSAHTHKHSTSVWGLIIQLQSPTQIITDPRPHVCVSSALTAVRHSVNIPPLGTVIRSNCTNIANLMLLISAYWRNAALNLDLAGKTGNIRFHRESV